jgi:ElaB/YqjD/DUF883 family membrane-anchored ribosome-binding protein
MAESKKQDNRYEEIDNILADIADIKNNVFELSKNVKDDIRSETKDGLRSVKGKSRETISDMENHVRDNPVRSVAIAFAGGVLASALMRRR